MKHGNEQEENMKQKWTIKRSFKILSKRNTVPTAKLHSRKETEKAKTTAWPV